MKNKLFLIFMGIVIGTLIQSCSTNTLYYGNANIYNKLKYLQKPVNLDTNGRLSFYVSGSYSATLDSLYYAGEKPYYSEGSLHLAYANNLIAAAFGTSVYNGVFNVVKAEDYAGKYDFWGYSITGDISFGKTFVGDDGNSAFRFHPLGIKFTFTDELGDYKKFKETAEDEIDLKNNSEIRPKPRIALYSDVDYMFNKDNILTLYAIFGSDKYYFLSALGINYQWKRFNVALQRTNAFETGQQLTFQLSYRFLDGKMK